MRKKLIVVCLILAAAGAAAAWFLHRPLMTRHYLGNVETAMDESTLERLADLGDPVVPRLVDLLQRDAPTCRNSGMALARILDRWPKEESRSAALAQRLGDGFAGFSPGGKQVALELAEILAQWVPACREPVHQIICDGMSDSSPEVRRAALLAGGQAREVMSDEEFLKCLHDADADVRELCETTLKNRGLRDKDLQLGRLISDPSPLKRLEVVRFLPLDAQLDAQAWLNRLCQDPSPAVRASAARTAMDPDSGLGVEMSERVRQMAQSDPDGTVRQIAEYLVRPRRAPAETQR